MEKINSTLISSTYVTWLKRCLRLTRWFDETYPLSHYDDYTRTHCVPIVIGWVIVRDHEGGDNHRLMLGIIGLYAFNARVITVNPVQTSNSVCTVIVDRFLMYISLYSFSLQVCKPVGTSGGRTTGYQVKITFIVILCFFLFYNTVTVVVWW